MTTAFPSATRPVLLSVLFALFGGLTAGTLAKLADESALPGVGMITTHFGVWVVCIAVIAAWSRSRLRAIVCSVTFLLAMVAAYYVVQMAMFGFFSPQLFLTWTVAALVLAPPFAALTWPARQVGWRAALGAALPIGLLLQEAYSMRFRPNLNNDYRILFAFDIICAIALLLIFSQERRQRVRIFALTPIIVIGANIGFNVILPYLLGLLLMG